MLYIYTVCYNTPQYIDYQFRLLKKFIMNDFEYIVFNNTMTNTRLTNENINNNNLLQTICKNHNIKYYDIPKQLFMGIHDQDASKRAGTAIDASHHILFKNYSLDSTFFLIDTDAFILSPFDVEKFMHNKKLSGRQQFRKGNTTTIKYITNHIVIFKPSCFDQDEFFENFSFLPCKIDNVGCDCGGKINFLFDKLTDADFVNWDNKLFSDSGNIKQQWGVAPDEQKDFNNSAISDLNDSNLINYILQDSSILKKKFPFCEILENPKNNNICLHMRAGTNWINYNIKDRNEILFQFLNNLVI